MLTISPAVVLSHSVVTGINPAVVHSPSMVAMNTFGSAEAQYELPEAFKLSHKCCLLSQDSLYQLEKTMYEVEDPLQLPS